MSEADDVGGGARSGAGDERKARAGSLEALASEIVETLGAEWLPRIYREQILVLRTRSHTLPVAADETRGRRKERGTVEVQHTLLGVELKVGNRRLSCPDLATARYLSVFARAGSSEVAVPYDITKISPLADRLESAWHRMLILVSHLAEDRNAAFRSRLRQRIVGEAKREIEGAGAGAAVPQFNQNTKQRKQRA